MDALRELGLSAYERRAYRALVATGAATARTVADRSDVPEGRIYDVLDGLEAKGLLKTQPGEPRRYAAVAPEDAIDRLLEARLEDLEERADRYRRLAAEVQSTFAPTPPVDGNVWLASLGDEDATTLAAEQLSTVSERFAMAVGPPYDGAPVDVYRSELEAFLEHHPRDCRVDILLNRTVVKPLSAYVSRLRESEADVTVRQTTGVDVTFDVVDGTEAYVDVPHPFADGTRLGFLEVRDPLVAAELEEIFDEAWEHAIPVE